MADMDPTSTVGIVATLSGGIGIAIVWGTKIFLRKMGLDPLTASEANSAAQKDMLDWQREQLKQEVERREKAEMAKAQADQQVHALLEKLTEVSGHMARLELQNDQLKSQMEMMSKQNQILQEHVELLTATVEQLKTSMVGAKIA